MINIAKLEDNTKLAERQTSRWKSDSTLVQATKRVRDQNTAKSEVLFPSLLTKLAKKSNRSSAKNRQPPALIAPGLPPGRGSSIAKRSQQEKLSRQDKQDELNEKKIYSKTASHETSSATQPSRKESSDPKKKKKKKKAKQIPESSEVKNSARTIQECDPISCKNSPDKTSSVRGTASGYFYTPEDKSPNQSLILLESHPLKLAGCLKEIESAARIKPAVVSLSGAIEPKFSFKLFQRKQDSVDVIVPAKRAVRLESNSASVDTDENGPISNKDPGIQKLDSDKGNDVAVAKEDQKIQITSLPATDPVITEPTKDNSTKLLKNEDDNAVNTVFNSLARIPSLNQLHDVNSNDSLSSPRRQDPIILSMVAVSPSTKSSIHAASPPSTKQAVTIVDCQGEKGAGPDDSFDEFLKVNRLFKPWYDFGTQMTTTLAVVTKSTSAEAQEKAASTQINFPVAPSSMAVSEVQANLLKKPKSAKVSMMVDSYMNTDGQGVKSPKKLNQKKLRKQNKEISQATSMSNARITESSEDTKVTEKPPNDKPKFPSTPSVVMTPLRRQDSVQIGLPVILPHPIGLLESEEAKGTAKSVPEVRVTSNSDTVPPPDMKPQKQDTVAAEAPKIQPALSKANANKRATSSQRVKFNLPGTKTVQPVQSEILKRGQISARISSLLDNENTVSSPPPKAPAEARRLNKNFIRDKILFQEADTRRRIKVTLPPEFYSEPKRPHSLDDSYSLTLPITPIKSAPEVQTTVALEFEKFMTQKRPVVWNFGYTQTSIAKNVQNTLSHIEDMFQLEQISLDIEVTRWATSPRFRKLSESTVEPPNFTDAVTFHAAKVLRGIKEREGSLKKFSSLEICELLKLAFVHTQVSSNPKGYIVQNFPISAQEGEYFESYFYPCAAGLYFSSNRWTKDKSSPPNVFKPRYITRNAQQPYVEAEVELTAEHYGERTIKVSNMDDLSPTKIQQIVYALQHTLDTYNKNITPKVSISSVNSTNGSAKSFSPKEISKISLRKSTRLSHSVANNAKNKTNKIKKKTTSVYKRNDPKSVPK